jgi:hypothetical protein
MEESSLRLNCVSYHVTVTLFLEKVVFHHRGGVFRVALIPSCVAQPAEGNIVLTVCEQ